MRRLRSPLKLLLLLPIAACNCDNEPGLIRKNGKLVPSAQVVDFGSVIVGTEELRPLALENGGDHPLHLEEPHLPAGPFAVVQRPPADLEPSGIATMVLSFTPPAPGPFEVTLELDNDGVDPTVRVTLRGVGAERPAVCTLTHSPQALDFSGAPTGQVRELAVELRNVSRAECTLSNGRVEGSSAQEFSLPTFSAGPVAAGGSASMLVRLSRVSGGALSALLVVETTDPARPRVEVPLSAAAIPMPVAGLCVMPTSIQFGRIMGSAMRTVNLTACGDHDVLITALDWTTANGEISLGGPPALPFTLARGLTQVLNVRYAPTDQMDDRAVLTVRSDDPLVPAVEVEVTGSNDIVPPEVGRFLYYWRVQGASPFQVSDVMRLALQGGGTPQAYFGQNTGRSGCPGCHHPSPDGRYMAVVEYGFFGPRIQVVDTMSNTVTPLPAQVADGATFSWRPDPTGNPSYRYVVGVRGQLHLGSLTGGYLGELSGANAPGQSQAMPSWGPGGEIVFVRGANDTVHDGFGFTGAADLLLIPENGGAAQPVPGASGNGQSNYYPNFSPNGRWISFTQSAAAGSTYSAPDARIRLVRADRSGTIEPLNALNGGGAASYPTWGLDGTFLSFSSNRAGGAGDWDIYLAPIDPQSGAAGAPTNLMEANTADFEHGAEWSR